MMVVIRSRESDVDHPFGAASDWKDVSEGKRLEEALAYLRPLCKLKKPCTSAISRNLLYYLVQGCTKRKDLCVAKGIFSLLRENGLEIVPPLGDPLIRLFAFHGLLSHASSVFLCIHKPSSHTWHAIISAHIAHGHHPKSLSLYHSMLWTGFPPSKFMLSGILKACTCTRSLCLGMAVHHQTLEYELDSQVAVGSALIALYSKCGILEDARYVFDRLPSRNVISWNTMLAGYTHHGDGLLAWELFEKMQQESLKPDEFTFSCILKACGIMESLGRGELVHKAIIQRGLLIDIVIGNALIDMYSKCANLNKAREVFENMINPNVISWNALTMGYAQHGLGFDALELFTKMQEERITPNKATFLSLLKACGSVSAKEEGKWIHNQTIISDLATDMEIGSALVDMYAHCGSLIDAHGVFDKLSNRDCVLCSTIISACVHHGHCSTALKVFMKMEEDQIKPDKVTLLCVLKACSSMKALNQGRIVHEQILNCGLVYDVVIRNSLIDVYIKCGNLDEARKLFDDFPIKNIVSWDSMIAGYAHAGFGYLALEIFEKMLLQGIDPDKVSFLCTLKASGGIGAILQGRLIHDMINRKGYENDAEVGNSLIDMYAKCGSLDEATRAFKLLTCHNLASWGALIAGYAQQGNFESANGYIDEMQQEGLKPIGMIYTSMLVACCQAGKVEEGHRQFALLLEDLVPAIEHYNCMIDLLGRSGHLREARRLLRAMPTSPDVLSWMSLLTSCKTYGNIHLGKQCYKEVVKLDPDNVAARSLMSDLAAEFNV